VYIPLAPFRRDSGRFRYSMLTVGWSRETVRPTSQSWFTGENLPTRPFSAARRGPWQVRIGATRLRQLRLPFLFLVMSGLARANNIFVNTTDGESPAAPLCSLPDAITAHNLQGMVNGCAAGDGLDVIVIEVTGTILIDEPLEITNAIVTIQGPVFGCSGAGPMRYYD